MRVVFIFLTLFCLSYASNLLTYDIYERTDRVDIMLSFDAPYSGNIFQKQENNVTLLVLNLLNFEQDINKSINSKIIQELSIKPEQNSLILSLKSQDPIAVNASKTADGFGLRIRATPKNAPILALPQTKEIAKTSAPASSTLNALNKLDMRYLIVIGALLALAMFLYIIKRLVAKKEPEFKGFSESEPDENLIKDPKNLEIKGENSLIGVILKDNRAKIIYQKPLDEVNKLMLLGYESRRYLVIVGSSNILLDSFSDDKIASEQEFEILFKENQKTLSEFMQGYKNALGEKGD